MSSVPRVCSACGAPSSWDARFCQQCGRPLRVDDAKPRYYGVLSPGPAFGLGASFLLAAVIALIVGRIVVAVLLLAAAVASLVFFYGAARRNPGDPVARTVVGSAHHARGWAVYVGTSAAAWTRALRELLRLRRESRSLRKERDPTVSSLGEAAYREDQPLVEALKARIREIDEELAQRDRDRARALAAARRRVHREREAASSTQKLSVDDIASAGDDWS